MRSSGRVAPQTWHVHAGTWMPCTSTKPGSRTPATRRLVRQRNHRFNTGDKIVGMFRFRSIPLAVVLAMFISLIPSLISGVLGDIVFIVAFFWLWVRFSRRVTLNKRARAEARV